MPQFHFPTNVKLSSPPLVEAWLEIRWTLEAVDPPELMRDPAFPFALGRFFEAVKKRFPTHKTLDSAQAPEAFLPHTPRYQFVSSDISGSVIQLGPGVATINFVSNYSWDQFFVDAEYLRSSLLSAYEGYQLEFSLIVLRYRNIEPFDYRKRSFFSFLKDNLNIRIGLPKTIPGSPATIKHPVNADIRIEYALGSPKAIGGIRVATGQRQGPEIQGERAIMWELSVASTGNHVTELKDKENFAEWMRSAHAVTHEWFLSLTQGNLLQQYGYHEIKEDSTE